MGGGERSIADARPSKQAPIAATAPRECVRHAWRIADKINLAEKVRDGDVELDEGEMYVVPRGVEHCPRADEEAHVLLIEPLDTVNTGDAGGAKTAKTAEPVEL